MKRIYLILASILLYFSSQAQYISLTQVPNNSCPTVCPGSILELEVYQVQSLNNGDTLQALISNSSGSFSSGTTTLSCTWYSLNQGSNWISGPFIYTQDVTNLYYEITIPPNFPAGNNYTIEMKSSSGYVSSGQFRCSAATGYFVVTPAYPTLAALPANSEGNNQWIGSVYSWSTTIPQSTVLNTPGLINQVNFFNASNYQGYFVLDSLPININYETGTGGTCPGTPGALNNGTSIPCSQGFSDLFSVRLERNENFPSGTYQLSIAGDDGIRLSTDGGNTWLLNSFYEQVYDTSNRSAAVCLSGPTHLVIEYFQRYVQSIITFKDSLISSNSASVSNPGNQTGCAGSNIAFNLHGNSNSLSYQWYYSTNGGSSFIAVPNTTPFTGVDSSVLSITSVPISYNNYLFRCQVGGLCGNPVTTAIDTLIVGGSGTAFNLTGKNPICASDSSQICAPQNCMAYLWSNGATTPCIEVNQQGNYTATVTYSTGCSAVSNHFPLRVYTVPNVSITAKGDTLSTLQAAGYQWQLNNNDIPGATKQSYIAQQVGTYTVLITDTNGCPDVSSQVSISSINAGINEVNNTVDFNIYPNPVGDGGPLVVITSSALYGRQLRMFDAEGRLAGIWIVNNTKTELSISNLARGVYFLTFEGAVRKVVKE